MEKYVSDLFDKLNEEIIKYNPYYDKNLINKAFSYSYEAHKSQYRKSRELYIIHPLHTAINLTKIEADDISIVCALLHDVLDNKSYNIEDIKYNFWEEITKIILWINKLWNLYYTIDMNKKDIENLKKSLVLVWNDIRIFLVKIADRLHNLQTLNFLPKQKRYRIAKETEEIYLPIVNFLSIWEFLNEMHDLCFKFTNETEYKELNKIFWKKLEYHKMKIIQAHNKLENEFQNLWLKIINIEWRVKSLYSIYKKIKWKNIDLTEIYDVLALRIITKNILDVYIILWIIHKLFKVKSDRFKDYISSPKDNWYQSIHTTVFDDKWEFLEFQIETLQMSKLNKSGLAAHFIYKWFWVEYKNLPPWMLKILDLQKKVLDQKLFLEKLNEEIVISEIKCFKADWTFLVLPKDSVLIDFAFWVDIEEGKYFSGAYINWIYIEDPFIKLKNWDFIKLEKKSNKINTDYSIEKFLQLKTKKAREEIKNIFKKYSSVKLIQLWKYLLNNSLETYSLRHFESYPNKLRKLIIKNFWLKNIEQFYLFIAMGSISVDKIINKISSNITNDKNHYTKNVSLKIKIKTDDFITINNINNTIYNLGLNIDKLRYNSLKNTIYINLYIDNNKTLDELLDELKRTPNVLDIVRIFPIRLKLYYIMFFFSIFLISILILLILLINDSKEIQNNTINLILFISAVFLFFIIYFLKHLVKTIFPDVLKYKRFWLSLFLLNTFILLTILWEYLYLWININIILYIIFSLFMYSILMYDFFSYKKSQNLRGHK